MGRGKRRSNHLSQLVHTGVRQRRPKGLGIDAKLKTRRIHGWAGGAFIASFSTRRISLPSIADGAMPYSYFGVASGRIGASRRRYVCDIDPPAPPAHRSRAPSKETASAPHPFRPPACPCRPKPSRAPPICAMWKYAGGICFLRY